MVESENNPSFDSEAAFVDAEICLREATEKIQCFVQRANDAESNYALKKNLPYLITLPLIEGMEDELLEKMHDRFDGTKPVISVADGCELRHWAAKTGNRDIFVTERRKMDYVDCVRRYEFDRAEVWLTPPKDIPLKFFETEQEPSCKDFGVLSRIGSFISRLRIAN